VASGLPDDAGRRLDARTEYESVLHLTSSVTATAVPDERDLVLTNAVSSDAWSSAGDQRKADVAP